MENQNIPGKSAATASMVLGIISIVCWFFGWSLIASVILGVGAVGGVAGLADIANSLN